MNRTTEVGVEASEASKAFLAKRTTIPRSVPGCASGHVCRRCLVAVPTDLLVGEHMIWIDFAAVLVDFLAIDAGRTGA